MCGMSVRFQCHFCILRPTISYVLCLAWSRARICESIFVIWSCIQYITPNIECKTKEQDRIYLERYPTQPFRRPSHPDLVAMFLHSALTPRPSWSLGLVLRFNPLQRVKVFHFLGIVSTEGRIYLFVGQYYRLTILGVKQVPDLGQCQVC